MKGIAAMTLMINATTAKSLLTYLNLLGADSVEKKLVIAQVLYHYTLLSNTSCDINIIVIIATIKTLFNSSYNCYLYY